MTTTVNDPGGGGAGGGGSGFTLRDPPDTFNGATQVAAETARDDANTGITDTAPWDDDPNLAIILTWPVVPTNTIYQVRRDDAWVDAVNTIRGPGGPGGSPGTPGGGALQLLGIFDETIVAATDDIWLDLGFDWPTESRWVLYSVNGGRSYWFDLEAVRDKDAAVIGAASAAADRSIILENVSGAVYFGRNAAGRALIEFASTVGAVVVSLFTPVPGPAVDPDSVVTALRNFLAAGVQSGIKVEMTATGELNILTGPPTHTSQYVAVKATNDFDATDFTGANGEVWGIGAIEAIPDTIAGNVYVAVARLAADDATTYADLDESGSNILGSLLIQSAVQIAIGGSAYNRFITSAAGDFGGGKVELR